MVYGFPKPRYSEKMESGVLYFVAQLSKSIKDDPLTYRVKGKSLKRMLKSRSVDSRPLGKNVSRLKTGSSTNSKFRVSPRQRDNRL